MGGRLGFVLFNDGPLWGGAAASQLPVGGVTSLPVVMRSSWATPPSPECWPGVHILQDKENQNKHHR